MSAPGKVMSGPDYVTMLLTWDYSDGETIPQKPASDEDMKLFLSDCEEAMNIIPKNELEMRKKLLQKIQETKSIINMSNQLITQVSKFLETEAKK
jgi:hypothetical protein